VPGSDLSWIRSLTKNPASWRGGATGGRLAGSAAVHAFGHGSLRTCRGSGNPLGDILSERWGTTFTGRRLADPIDDHPGDTVVAKIREFAVSQLVPDFRV